MIDKSNKSLKLLICFILVFILSVCCVSNVYAYVHSPDTKTVSEFNVKQLSSKNSSGASSGWTTGSFSEGSSPSYSSGSSSSSSSSSSSMSDGDFIALLRFLQMFLFFLPPSMRPIASVILLVGGFLFYVKKVKNN